MDPDDPRCRDMVPVQHLQPGDTIQCPALRAAALRAETAHQGIKVLVVAPGSVRTNVSRNALDANARTRGFSDAPIDNGMDPLLAARRILDALDAGVRELIFAEGFEAEIARLRRADPDAACDLMAQMIAAGYAREVGAERAR